METSSILTEVGTNELEVVEFEIDGRSYAINVAKVREIVRFQDPIPIPHTHPCVLGVFRNRDDVIPMVDLGRWLESEAEIDPKHARIIIAEFNRMRVGFLVHRVERIHRTHWGALEAPEGSSLVESPATLGIIRLGEGESQRILFLLDFERIVAELAPNRGLRDEVRMDRNELRRGRVILLAEDSEMVRTVMKRKLEEGGYTVLAVKDGAAAWEVLDSETRVDLVISDIEMPRMDGHHLIKRIREDERFQNLPVVLYSSMIYEEMREKGESLGATAQICKPELPKLLETVDRLILDEARQAA